MEDLIARYRQTLQTDLDTDLLPEIVECVCNGSSSLVDLVSSLESLLVSVESVRRAAATQLLADVLHLLPTDLLTTQQLHFIVTFFVDRAKDHITVLPAVLHASQALLRQEHVGPAEVRLLLRGLLKEVHCQSQLMAVRGQLYTALRLACTQHPLVVDSMFDEFILGVVSAADGEKDPRNLLLVFSLVPLIATSNKIAHMTEELFEVVAAYFPIDFVPPAHDPDTVTSEDLVLGLRRCLSCTPAWAPYLLPLLLEKMESDLPSAKMDAYLTLSSCCSVYSWAQVREWAWPVWSCVRREAVAQHTGEAVNTALGALTSLTRTLYTQGTEDTQQQDDIVNKAAQECFPHMCEGPLAEAACKLLTALVAADRRAAALVCHKVLPLLCAAARQRSSAATALRAVGELMHAAAQHGEACGVVGGGVSDECASVVSDALLADGSHVGAVTAALRGFTDTAHWPLMARHCLHMLLNGGNSEQQLRASLLSAISAPNPERCSLLSEHLLPACSDINEDYSADLDARLAAVVAVSVGRDAVSLTFEQLWPLPPHGATRTCAALAQVLEGQRSDVAVSDWLRCWGGVTRVAGVAVRADHDLPLLKALSRLCRSMVATTGSEVAVQLAAQVLIDAPITPDNCIQLQHLVHVLDGLLVSVESVAGVSCDDTLLLWATHPRVTQDTRHTAALLLAAILNKTPTGSALCHRVEMLSSALRPLLPPTAEVDEGRASRAVAVWGWMIKAMEMRAAPQAIPWMDTLESLLGAGGAAGVAAAHCYSVLLSDDSYALTAHTHCTVRLLYRQRVFERIVGRLVDRMTAATGPHRHCVLMAIAALLPHVPTALLHQHMHRLVVVLVEGVRCSGEVGVVEGVVNSLRQLLDGGEPPPVQLDAHAGALLPALLALATANPKHGHHSRIQPDKRPDNGTSPSDCSRLIESVDISDKLTSVRGSEMTGACQSLAVREGSLVCLARLVKMSPQHVLPYREQVLREARPALDDHKRLVRRAAAEVRCAWMLLQAPGT